MPSSQLAASVLDASYRLRDACSELLFTKPVAYTYNPLTYAMTGYEAYVSSFVHEPIEVLYLGMNPGPFGMAQTGVPFGEVEAVSRWMGIHTLIGQPTPMHPKRPIQGFACPRSEVSGRRLWGMFEELYGTAESFFRQSFVANYIPLIWMSESGANITPDKLPKEQRDAVESLCHQHLVELIKILQPRCLIGVGAYALKKLERAAAEIEGASFALGTILHPSPASPIANKQWPERPKAQLAEIFSQAGIVLKKY